MIFGLVMADCNGGQKGRGRTVRGRRGKMWQIWAFGDDYTTVSFHGLIVSLIPRMRFVVVMVSPLARKCNCGRR